MSRFVEKAEVSKEDLDFQVTNKHIFIKRDNKYHDLSKKPDDKNDKTKFADRTALWNEKDDCLLSVISSKYNPVEHGIIIESLDEALSNLRIDPISTKYYSTPNRNLAWIDVQLKPKEVIIGNNKDDWTLGMSILHGLDGIRGLQVSSFIERVVCTNGMRSKKLLGQERVTHRTPDIVGWFEKTTRKQLDDIDLKFKIIPKLYEIDIEIFDFEQKVQKLIGKKFTETVIEEIRNPSENNPLYKVEEKTLSLYDALSALTFVNTNLSENVGARVLAHRHHRIEEIINSYYLG